MKSILVLSFVSLSVLAAMGGCGGSGDTGGTGAANTGGGGSSVSSSSSASASGTGGNGGTGGTGGAGAGPELTNNDSTCEAGSIAQAMGEDGHLAAAQLTPPSYPFVITSIQYVLVPPENNNCETGLAHQVDLFVGTDITLLTDPDTMPPNGRHFDVPAETNLTEDRLVTLEVNPPLEIASGDLFIAVKFGGMFPDHVLCVGSCGGPAFKIDRNWWSNAAMPPYSWQELSSFGSNGSLEQNYRFDAFGHPM